MKNLFFTCILILISIISINAQTVIDSIYIDGILRTYRVFIPENIQGQSDLPLVLNFHGFGSNSVQQEVYTGMNFAATANGFIVVYPEGIDNAWNVGFLGTSDTDVEFTEKIIDQLYFDHQINLAKVYSCGMSNGGYFSYRLACEIPERFAAIASVTGSMLYQSITDCVSDNKMPIMQIHGTADASVEYDGSTNGASIQEVLNFWAEKNNCDSTFTTEFIADINTTDASTVEKISFENCDADVVLFKVLNGTHTWPDAILNLTGVTNKDINANTEIWNFFNNYEIQNPVIPTSTSILPYNFNTNVLNNPFKNSLQLTANEILTDVEIYNSSMKLMKSIKNINSNSLNINTSELISGIYFVAVKSKESTNFIKAVKL